MSIRNTQTTKDKKIDTEQKRQNTAAKTRPISVESNCQKHIDSGVDFNEETFNSLVDEIFDDYSNKRPWMKDMLKLTCLSHPFSEFYSNSNRSQHEGCAFFRQMMANEKFASMFLRMNRSYFALDSNLENFIKAFKLSGTIIDEEIKNFIVKHGRRLSKEYLRKSQSVSAKKLGPIKAPNALSSRSQELFRIENGLIHLPARANPITPQTKQSQNRKPLESDTGPQALKSEKPSGEDQNFEKRRLKLVQEPCVRKIGQDLEKKKPSIRLSRDIKKKKKIRHELTTEAIGKHSETLILHANYKTPRDSGIEKWDSGIEKYRIGNDEISFGILQKLNKKLDIKATNTNLQAKGFTKVVSVVRRSERMNLAINLNDLSEILQVLRHPEEVLLASKDTFEELGLSKPDLEMIKGIFNRMTTLAQYESMSFQPSSSIRSPFAVNLPGSIGEKPSTKSVFHSRTTSDIKPKGNTFTMTEHHCDVSNRMSPRMAFKSQSKTLKTEFNSIQKPSK